MRVSSPRKSRRVGRIWWVVAAIALCGVSLPGIAVDLGRTLPNLWASAAALSLTLATAAKKN
jgi:hypothetical protein